MSAIVVVVAHANDARGLCLLPHHGDSAHADMVTSVIGNAPVTNGTDLAKVEVSSWKHVPKYSR